MAASADFFDGPGAPRMVTRQSATTTLTPQLRLTLTSGVAITTTDVTGATAHYCTTYPTVGGPSYAPITLNGNTFTMVPVSEMTQATTDTTKSPAAVAASSVYDVFLWFDGSTSSYRCTRGPAWTSDTSRGTGPGSSQINFTTLLPTNAFTITNGPSANLGILIGSIRSNASSQLVDSYAFRWVSNAYNAVERPMAVFESAVSWTYTTATYHQANANAANQLDILQTLSGSMAHVTAVSSFTNSTSGGGVYALSAIGLDSTNTPVTNFTNNFSSTALPITSPVASTSNWNGYVGIGRHVLTWLEQSQATGTTTFYGNAGLAGTIQLGISGFVLN